MPDPHHPRALGPGRHRRLPRPSGRLILGGAPATGGCGSGRLLLHLIQETARHAGHTDILREQLDGAVGR
ncbi:mycothiol transferase [Kribbella sp. CA-293567]|uniref:mycothiol transferase n=1 Tax=Kribbella sp. CA-293567 TaxID=3002436 RepID=UPI0022DD3993|nr:DUF664 domain-containing protein [Kribbella sp. CA-293567]WBQ02324.1 DUF664 domain-containing protein [Kribbella sp. CA-293567]